MFEGLIIFGKKVSAKSQRILADLNRFWRKSIFYPKIPPFSSQQKPNKIINLLPKAM